MLVPQPTTNTPAYTEFHPRWYRPHVSTYWWLGQRHYLKFILREVSSVFVAFFVAITLLQLRALKAGPEAYARLQHTMKSPLLIGLCLISLFFLVFHTITWFNLTPRAIAVRFQGRRLPDFMVAAPNYVVWAVVSGVVAWVILR
jgi:succinate dehydrogenase subunit C